MCPVAENVALKVWVTSAEQQMRSLENDKIRAEQRIARLERHNAVAQERIAGLQNDNMRVRQLLLDLRA